MSWDSLERAAENGPGALFFWGLWRGLLALVIFSMIGGGIAVVGFAVNPFKQAGRIVDKTIDADNVIANYEWFKTRHEDIEAIGVQIVQAQTSLGSFQEIAGPPNEWDRTDKEEFARLRSILDGLKYQRSRLVAEYNAKSRMVNRSIFKAGDRELPERIEL